ncbi:hypothetical protein EMCRGX_G010535 [Ephydatia muelleri]
MRIEVVVASEHPGFVLRKVISKRQGSILQFVSNPKSDHDVSHQESSATSSEQEAPIQLIDAAGCSHSSTR